MALTALLLIIFLLYWQSPELVDSAASLGVRVSTSDVDTSWEKWNFVRSLRSSPPNLPPFPLWTVRANPNQATRSATLA